MRPSAAQSPAEAAVCKDGDLHRWFLDQAAALRARRYNSVDWERLAEELEAMAKGEERGLASQLQRLLTHLLKCAYQSNRKTGSWEASIENARDEIEDYLQTSPSLRTQLGELATRAYLRARRTAGAQMGLNKRQWEKRLPESCPWSLSDVLRHEFWPRPLKGSNARNR
jgi:uncharacterized protein DUF29